jgi:serine/threonine-protein kinase
MKCSKCGTQLEHEARFCGVCGTPVLGAPGPASQPADVPATVRLQSGLSPPQKVPPAAGSSRPPGPAPAPLYRPVGPAPIAPVPGDPFIGKTLNNRYLVEGKLGEGGFGAVYRARQVQIGRQVALKLLHPDTARDPNLVARFRREGAVACSLKDAHTITTYDFDQTPEGVLYIAMELLSGRSLHEVFHSEAPIAWTRVVAILEQMCSSLGEAHATGIVHRDLKPENIYLETRPGVPEFVKILDFGIAKIVGGEIGQNSPQLTASGQTLGTLEYRSPEQRMGKPHDGRSDIYAMGVLGFELLTGRLPFPDATGPAALIAAQLKKTPPPPSVARPASPLPPLPPAIDQLIARMLEKDRNNRFADTGALAAECHQLLAQVAPPPMMMVSAGSSGAMTRPLTPQPAPVMTPPQATLAAQPPSGASASGPSTEDLIADAAGVGKRWIWVLLAVLVVAGGVVLALALKK